MKLSKFVFPLVLGVLFAGFFGVQHAHAVAGRALERGYFTNADINNYSWDDVWAGGIQSLGAAPTKPGLEALVNSKLNSGGGRDAVGAAYIIETMIGRSGASFGSSAQGIAQAKADYNNWVSRVNNPAVTMAMEYLTYTINSAYIDGLNDVGAYGEGGSANALVFRVGGVAHYVIKQICANPLGDYAGLPAPVTNNPPSGTITLACTQSNGYFDGFGTATIRFSDPDATTVAIITDGTGKRLTPNENSGFVWTVPTYRTAAGTWTLKLYVYDRHKDGTYGTADYVDGATGRQCIPTGTLTLACHYNASGQMDGTGVATTIFGGRGDNGYIADSADRRLTTNHGSGLVWSVPASIASVGNWSLRSYVYVPGVSTPFYEARATHAPCVNNSTSTSVTCDDSTLQTTMGAGSSQTFTVSFNISANPPAAPTNPAMTVEIKGPSGFDQKLTNEHYRFASDGSGGEITSDPITFTPPGVGSYTLTWSLSNFVSQDCGYGSANGGEPNQTDVAYLPYFQVQGGDIAAGIGIGDSGCDESPADIKGQNTNTTAAPNFFGAGSTIGAWATGSITNFVSGMGLSGGAATQNGHGVSFANITNNAPPSYGGSYSDDLPCLPDYFAGATGGNVPPTGLNGLPAGVHNFTVDASGSPANIGVLGPITVNAGTTINLYINGDAIISNNIVYGSYGYATVPEFNLYVKGSIYIDSGVTELHGTYVAQKKDDDSGGDITTCANSQNVVLDESVCRAAGTPLTIVGSTVAEGNLRLNRTWGNLYSVPGYPNQPAEIFQYNPELWLSNPTDGKINAYTSLPPVL